MKIAILAALAGPALGCVTYPDGPPFAPQRVAFSRDGDPYGEVIARVASMVDDHDLARAANRRRLALVNVAWEDTGRALGSSLGPNISDLTLQVRRRLRRGAALDGPPTWILDDTKLEPPERWETTLMPVIRHPNFTDETADVRADLFFARVGNARGDALESVPLLDVLRDVGRFASAPSALGAEPESHAAIDLSAPRDTHFLVSAQAVFLPISHDGQADFSPVVFNYQSAPGSPAVLTMLITREGTSIAVLENRDGERSVGWGQELSFNAAGQRASFRAERRSDVARRIASRGGPRTAAERSALARGADVMALVQVPLVHQNRGLLGGVSGSTSGYGYEFSDDPLAAGGFGPNDATIRVRPGPVATSLQGGGDVERAVIGHGATLGPFLEGWGTRLVRDPKFPVRITLQFYKATSDAHASERDLDAIATSLASAYSHADFVGSLVVPDGDPRRPTAWQSMPNEWFPW